MPLTFCAFSRFSSNISGIPCLHLARLHPSATYTGILNHNTNTPSDNIADRRKSGRGGGNNPAPFSPPISRTLRDLNNSIKNYVEPNNPYGRRRSGRLPGGYNDSLTSTSCIPDDRQVHLLLCVCACVCLCLCVCVFVSVCLTYLPRGVYTSYITCITAHPLPLPPGNTRPNQVAARDQHDAAGENGHVRDGHAAQTLV